MTEFNSDNTEDYTQPELDALNAEWIEIVAEKNLDEHTEEYDVELKKFSDEVSSR